MPKPTTLGELLLPNERKPRKPSLASEARSAAALWRALRERHPDASMRRVQYWPPPFNGGRGEWEAVCWWSASSRHTAYRAVTPAEVLAQMDT